VRLKTRVLAAVSSLACAGGMIAVAAPSASAVVVTTCSGSSLSHAVLTPGLTDVNQTITIKSAVLKDNVTAGHPKLGGTCSVGYPSNTDFVLPSGPPAATTPKAIAAKFVGRTSCAMGATATAAAAAAGGPSFPPTGKITYTMSQVWPAAAGNTNAGKPVAIAVTGAFNGTNLDLAQISGLVTKGASYGGQADIGVWQDPAMLATPGYLNSGWTVDGPTAAAIGGPTCSDGTTGNNAATLVDVITGSGTSPLSGLNPTFAGYPDGLSVSLG